MSNEEGRTKSIWTATADIPFGDALTADEQADVCIVGAGIAGLSAAYLLSKAGRSVIVLEDGTIGSGETGRTTGHLSNALDDRYISIERMHGREGAATAASS